MSSVYIFLLIVIPGVLMGIAIRTGSPLSLNLAESVWKQLAGMTLTIADLTEIDKDYVPGIYFYFQYLKNYRDSCFSSLDIVKTHGQILKLMYFAGLLYIRDMDPGEKNFLDIPFSTTSSSGQEIFLSSSHRKVTLANKHEYIRLALNYR